MGTAIKPTAGAGAPEDNSSRLVNANEKACEGVENAGRSQASSALTGAVMYPVTFLACAAHCEIILEVGEGPLFAVQAAHR